MKDRSFDPRALDVAAFCRAGASLSGAWPLAPMERLAASLAAAPDTAAAWSAQGRTVAVSGGEPQLWIELQARAEVPLVCQRCLQPMVEPLAFQRPFRFARTETEAAALDEESEEDVLVVEPRFDLHELVEDELILVLPLVPRHADCAPLVSAAAAAAEGAAPHPFAALAALRQGGGASEAEGEGEPESAEDPRAAAARPRRGAGPAR